MRKTDHLPQLIQNIATKDCERSFESLFNIYFPRLFDIANMYLKNHPAAGEVVNDVFVNLWNSRTKLTQINDLRSYLFICVKQQSLNFLRDTKNSNLFVNDLNTTHHIDFITPENVMLTNELLDCISEAIDALPEKCRLIFKMVKEDKLKYKHVAEYLDISEKTVEMQVGIALKRIKSAVDLYYTSSSVPGKYNRDLIIGLALIFIFTGKTMPFL